MTEVYVTNKDDAINKISALVNLGGHLNSVPTPPTDKIDKYKAAMASYHNALRKTVLYMSKVHSGRASHTVSTSE